MVQKIMANRDHKKIEAHFYKSLAEKEPVREWLLECSKEDRKIIGTDIQTVEYGWPIGMPVCRSMGNGLYEIRTSLGGGRIARIFFCFYADKIILLHGIIKKSQKTPKNDLELAKKRQKEVING